MKFISKVIICIGVIILLYGSLYLRFKNPQMTETELLLNFWKIYFSGAVITFTGYVIFFIEEQS